MSVSEPHIDEFAANFMFIYISVVRHAVLPAPILRILVSCVNSKTIHNKVACIMRILYLFDGRWRQHRQRPLMDLPIHWLERWVNHEQSNQALYLFACGDSKLDEVHTYLFTDLRPVHVLQNTWCARPVCSMHIGPCVVHMCVTL